MIHPYLFVALLSVLDALFAAGEWIATVLA